MAARTDYEAHDGAYQRKRAEGLPGWNTPAELREMLVLLARCFDAPTMPRSGRALELGCGAGDTVLWLAERGFDVHGIDISETAIAWAREKVNDKGLVVELEVGSVLDRPQPSHPYDVVVDGHCLHCIIGSDRSRFFATARRALALDGVLLVRTMCGEPTRPAIVADFDRSSRLLVGNGVATRYIGEAAAILGEIRDAGFAITRSWIQPAVDVDDQDELFVEARLAEPERRT